MGHIGIRWTDCLARAKNFWSLIHVAFMGQSDRWTLWIPVGLSLGIAGYCLMHHQRAMEHHLPFIFAGLFLVLPMALFILMAPFFYDHPIPTKQNAYCPMIWHGCVRFLSWGVLWGCIGAGSMMMRTWSLRCPVIHGVVAPVWITGHVQEVDHLASTSCLFQRVVLKIKDNSPAPSALNNMRVRVTIRTSCAPLYEGDIIRFKVQLMPLSGPNTPGGYDGRLQAFYDKISGVGFALTSPDIVGRKPSLIQKWRHYLTRYLHQHLSPPLGAIACGLVTGDKAALPDDVRQKFSVSGLAHILAIAGLHISIVSGICFSLCRRALALIPSCALYLNLDKIAGIFSLGVGWFYLHISGNRCPAQRAFWMMASAVFAVFMVRKRHAMRTLMLCASGFLIFMPESLFTLSYQLSFGSVAALLALYEHTHLRTPYLGYFSPNKRHSKRVKKGSISHFFLSHLPKKLGQSLGSSSAITLFTLPIMIAHFQQISFQGLLSNMIAIPYTAFVIAPLGIFSLLSMATPWADAALKVWSWSLSGLVSVASWSSIYLKSCVVHFGCARGIYFAGQMLGLFWFILWRYALRWWGIGIGLIFFIMGRLDHQYPWILIDTAHRMWAFLDYKSGSLYVSTARRGKKTAQRWMDFYGLHQKIEIKDGQNFSPTQNVHIRFDNKSYCGVIYPHHFSMIFSIDDGGITCYPVAQMGPYTWPLLCAQMQAMGKSVPDIQTERYIFDPSSCYAIFPFERRAPLKLIVSPVS